MKNEKKYSNYQENVIILINSLYSFNHAKLNLQDQRTKIPRLLTQHHAKAKKKKKKFKTLQVQPAHIRKFVCPREKESKKERLSREKKLKG